jgi:hypothetical protein
VGRGGEEVGGRCDDGRALVDLDNHGCRVGMPRTAPKHSTCLRLRHVCAGPSMARSEQQQSYSGRQYRSMSTCVRRAQQRALKHVFFCHASIQTARCQALRNSHSACNPSQDVRDQRNALTQPSESRIRMAFENMSRHILGSCSKPHQHFVNDEHPR